MFKRGSFLRVLSAITGSAIFLVAIYFLNKDDFLNTAIFGVIGVLLIAISAFPFIRK